MLTAFLAIVAIIAFGVAVVAGLHMRTLGVTFWQGLTLAAYSIVFRLDAHRLAAARAAEGPVIFAITEQSRLDPAIFLAGLPEDTLHVLDPASATHWPVESARPLARSVVFDKEKMIANRRLVKHLKAGGRLAVYFPARVEPDEQAFRLYRAVTLLARMTNARIVPMIVRNARFLPSSFTSAEKAPRHRFPALRIHALKALTVAELVHRRGSDIVTPANALFDRMAEVRFASADHSQGVHSALVSAARIYGPGQDMLEDTITGTLTYKRALIGARVLGKRFGAMSQPGEAIGVMLPNANAAVVSFFALAAAGRVAAMLNYTAGHANVVSAVNTAKIRTVITSRAFIEKAELGAIVDALTENGTTLVWLEDLRETVTTAEKLTAAALWRWPIARQASEAPACILFTSGTEGRPKGVVLSHRNLIANAAQSEARVSISVKDSLFNVLPLFHSFGLTGGMVLPVLYGVKLFLYPSPLHYKLIPQVAAKVRPTIMFGTDTFLAGYARTAKDTDFLSLRFVVAGAEAVRAETADTYRRKFGCRILEGYGMTEAAPVVAVNSATHGRLGTVGRPLPGVEIRLEPVEGIADGARMWLRGPNIMMGYLKADRPGQLQPIEGGWYDTGDIVSIDHEGFITIRGRAKRFAKIGGEMVSLGAVEMLIQSLWPEDRHAALSIEDRRKGERIVLATTRPDPDKRAIAEHTKKAGASKLMVPSDIVKVEDIPVLGSGKTDYVTTQERVMALIKRLRDAVPGRSRPTEHDAPPDDAKDERTPEEAPDKPRKKAKASSR